MPSPDDDEGITLDATLDAPLDAPAMPAPAALLAFAERYEDLGLIAAGGMGAVRRVRDRHLGRVVAMKVLRGDREHDAGLRARFRAEVLRTASLQHPGIVSVYDWGEQPGGRLWFTMPEVAGQTLAHLIAQAHQAQDESLLRRLLSRFSAACEAVAYAHSRAMIHRDLKPDNLMVGAFGEVLVMDLGIARRITEAEDPFGEEAISGRGQTRHGQILGTPGYMPPEQALGALDQVGPRSDVFALGAVLYEILSGKAPYPQGGRRALQAVLDGPPPPLPTAVAAWPLPAELRAICARALARAPADRYADAGELAAEVTAWLDGARRRDQAQALVAEAAALLPELERLRARAAALRAEADRLLSDVAPHAPVARKLPAWQRQDEALALDSEVILLETRHVEVLQSALRVHPDLDAAKDALADSYRARVEEAERRRDDDARLRSEALLRSYDRGQHRAFLRGEGRLTLRTDPPGAVAHLYAYTLHERRLQPTFLRTLGPTPIRDLALPGGSYQIRLEAAGCAPVGCPVLIERGQHWGADAPPLPLLSEAAPGPDEVYVPAGWFLSGGDPEAPDSLPRRRIWVAGFCISRSPITNAAYLTFLNDQRAHGVDVEALLPRRRAGVDASEHAPAPVYDQGPDGRFCLSAAPDDTGLIWQPDWPVVLLTWDAAHAYCRWRAARDGLPWRLPDELEREKAARGVDGRFFPWGDFCDPTWAQVLGSKAGPPGFAAIGTHPADRSPYGLLDGAGNVRDWCGNAWHREGPTLEDARLLGADHEPGDVPYRAIRGGSWSSQPRLSRVAARFAAPPGHRLGTLGFRITRTIQ